MPNAFFIRPRIIAGSAFVLFVFLLDFSGKQTGGDEQGIVCLTRPGKLPSVESAHDPGGGDNLTGVSLCMFGDMKQQAENAGGKLRAADGAGFEENLISRRANHAQSFVYL